MYERQKGSTDRSQYMSNDLKVMRRFIWTAVVLACMVCCDVICTTVNDWHFSGPNIALHKNATQKPGTYQEFDRLRYREYSYPASLAVDGNDDNDFAHKSCSHTNGTLIRVPSQHIAQWLVDLGGGFYVTGIIIVNRKDLKVRLKDFVVFGFSETFCSQTDDWCQIYNDTNLNMYRRDEIYIRDDTKQAYSQIAINLPKHSGYPDNGLSYLTLCEVKIYAAPQPVCKVKGQFGKSEINIYNNTGTIVNGLYTAGTVIRTSCKEGFLISGSALSKCLSSGNWTTNPAKCNVVCKLMRIVNGYMYPNQTLHGVNAKATIACNEGFQPRSQNITCMNTGYWNSYDLCKQVQCDYPGKPQNGYYVKGIFPSGNVFSPSSSLPFKSTITGKCDIGYESKVSEDRQCQSNNAWSGESPICKRKQCPYPEYITNGVYRHKNGTLYNSGFSFYNTTIDTICNTGYILKGSKEITCRSDKTWGTISKCQRVMCAFPETPKNGVYATKNRDTFRPYSDGPSHYLDIIHKLCPARYILNSSSEVRQCLETGLWSGEPGNCVSVTCKRLEELEGGFYNYTNKPSSNGFPYNTTVTAHCYETFRLSDYQHKSRRCTGKGEWDQNQVVCVSEVSKSEGERKVLVIVCSSVAAVLIIIVTSALAIILSCRKRRRQRNERESNLYTDLSCERRTPESEYSNTYELQLPKGLNSAGKASSHEAESCSAAGKEGPFYCNITLK